MPKIKNDIRISKYGKERLNVLLNSFMVNDYHKTLLKAIASRMPKNVSKADIDLFELLSKEYQQVI